MAGGELYLDFIGATCCMHQHSLTRCEIRSGPSVSELLKHVSDPELRTSVLGASLVLLPRTSDGSRRAYDFLPGTQAVFRFLGDHLPDDITVELASTDAEYRELGLHGADLWIPTLLVLAQNPHAVSVMLNVVSNYIYDCMRGMLTRDVRVKSEVLIDRIEGTVSIQYDGPAETYESVVRDAIARALRNDPKKP